MPAVKQCRGRNGKNPILEIPVPLLPLPSAVPPCGCTLVVLLEMFFSCCPFFVLFGWIFLVFFVPLGLVWFGLVWLLLLLLLLFSFDFSCCCCCFLLFCFVVVVVVVVIVVLVVVVFLLLWFVVVIVVFVMVLLLLVCFELFCLVVVIDLLLLSCCYSVNEIREMNHLT